MRAATCLLALLVLPAAAIADPLPSWRDGPARDRITAFVEGVTEPGGPDYVTPSRRIAVFDNDGTLWAEKPVYFQVLFALDRIAAMAEADPAVLTSAALEAAAAGDLEGVLAGGKEGLVELIAATHSGLTVAAFQDAVRDWLATARHPETGRPFTEMVYQPMLELLRYLRDEGFATYIVSGGGIDFMRAFAEDVYGIPPAQVIGSMGDARYEVEGGVPAIAKDSGLFFIDDKAGKPVGIARHVGRRPIFVAGNSDGDFEMLEWSTAGTGPRFGMIVHHTDAERAWAYDRESHVGRLARGLDEGPERGWLIVDMARDWGRVWPSADE